MTTPPPPEGFDPATWALLSPEQKAAYTNPQGNAEAQQQAAAMQEKMMKEVKKQMFLAIAFSMVTTVIGAVIASLIPGARR